MLIGLTGPARVGKSTAARIMRERFNFCEASFAAQIRQFVCELFGMSLEQMERTKTDPVPGFGSVTPRHAMQTLGTEWGRDLIHPDLWVISTMRRVSPILAVGRDVVISDVRFENEARAIRQAGGHIIEVERSIGVPGGEESNHRSEAGLPWDMTDASVLNTFDGDDPLAHRLEPLIQLYRKP
jgi:hypothetical protein